MAKKKNEVVVTAQSEVVAETSELCFCPDEAQTALLVEIAEATKNGGFLYTSPAVNAPLLAAGLVEINSALVNEAGDVATRATTEGMKYMSNATEVKPSETASEVQTLPETMGSVEVPANKFELVKVPLPDAKKAGRGRGVVYPFDKMEVGDSFFIPGADAPKKFASTVSSATARFAVPVPGEMREKRTLVKGEDGEPVLDEAGNKTYTTEMVQKTKPTRQFVIRAIPDGAPWGEQYKGVAGAGIWRTA